MDASSWGHRGSVSENVASRTSDRRETVLRPPPTEYYMADRRSAREFGKEE